MAWYLENYNYQYERGYRAIMYFGEDYILTDRDTVILGAHLNTPKHRFIFKTFDAAKAFIRSHSDHPLIKYSTPSTLEDYLLPNCNRECTKCNKKNKKNCRNLRNSTQNYCGFRMSSFPPDFVPDPKRLDAPCEKCLTKRCPYNMNTSM